jgi:hypothetical protein
MTSRSAPPTVFRARLWVKCAVLASLFVFVAGAVFGFRTEGPSWLPITFTVLAILGLVGVVEVFRLRVELREDELIVVSGWRKRRLSRELLERVTWQAGAGVSIRLKDGSWVRLPDVGLEQPGPEQQYPGMASEDRSDVIADRLEGCVGVWPSWTRTSISARSQKNDAAPSKSGVGR